MLVVHFSLCWLFMFHCVSCSCFTVLAVHVSLCWLLIFNYVGCSFFTVLVVHFSLCWLVMFPVVCASDVSNLSKKYALWMFGVLDLCLCSADRKRCQR